jgi:FtsZ-interacting cell division protein ZipA
MVAEMKKWWQDQSSLIIMIMGTLLAVFMTGLWMNISEMKSQIFNAEKDMAVLRESIPKDYTSLVTYLQDKAIIRVHDEQAQAALSSIQSQLAVSNQMMQALTETLKDYRREYRQDNPYVKEPGKKGREAIKHYDE